MKEVTENNNSKGSGIKGINREYNKQSYNSINITTNRQK